MTLKFVWVRSHMGWSGFSFQDISRRKMRMVHICLRRMLKKKKTLFINLFSYSSLFFRNNDFTTLTKTTQKYAKDLCTSMYILFPHLHAKRLHFFPSRAISPLLYDITLIRRIPFNAASFLSNNAQNSLKASTQTILLRSTTK